MIYIGMVIEIRRARSDRTAAEFYEEIFCAHLFPF